MAGDVLHQLEERGLGPVRVVEDEDERPGAASAAKSRRTAQNPSSTRPRRLHQARQTRDRLGDRVPRVLVGLEQRLELGDRAVRPVALGDPAGLLGISASGQNVIPSP